MPAPGEHPDPTEISELTEGLLAHERATRLRAHLAECVSCAEIRSSLEEIRSVLGTLPGPARMPADVAERIDAALAAEALLDAGAPAAPAPRTTGDHPRTVTSGPSRGGVSRETSAAAGGPAGGRPATDRPAGRGPAATGPGRTPARRRRRALLLTAAGVVAALGLGGAILQGVTLNAGAGSADTATSQEAAGADGLERQVQRLLDRQQTTDQDQGRQKTPDLGARQSPGVDAPFAGGRQTLPSCIREGIGRAQPPLAVDPAAPYQGRPAYLVVLPHPGAPERVDAYVVDSSCTTGSAPGPGEVLQKRTYERS
ncbi:hypothetical protein HOY81_03695 [Streptomyces sp. JJ36]|nr:hypothetical protein [Streptomyces sp. JJ36]